MNAKHSRELVGARLSHYRVCAPLGAGGMGTVYRAVDERRGREVALKVLRADVSDVETYRTLVDEACILSKLNHPNIAAVYDLDSTGGRAFLVLEFVPGLTLEELVGGVPLPPGEIVRLGVQMTRALAAAHAAGIVHRDIKPANIKLTPSGELKLLDFGIARLEPDGGAPVTDTTGHGTALMGTLPFMSPEQLRGEAVDARSDIFSAGAVLYHMATARPPFPQRQLGCLLDALLNLDPIAPRVINDAIPRGLETVILRSLRKAPGDRYRNASDLATALEAAMIDAAAIRRATAALRACRLAIATLGRRRTAETS